MLVPSLAVAAEPAEPAEPAWAAQARAGGHPLAVPPEVYVVRALRTTDGRVWVVGNRGGIAGWVGLLRPDGTVSGKDVGPVRLDAVTEVAGGVAVFDGTRVLKVSPTLETRTLAGPFTPEAGFEASAMATCGGTVTAVGLHNPLDAGVTELWRVTGTREWRHRPDGYATLTDVACEGDVAVAVGGVGGGDDYDLVVVRGDAVKVLPRPGWEMASAIVPGGIVGLTAHVQPLGTPGSPGKDLLFQPFDGPATVIPATAAAVDAVALGDRVLAVSDGRASALWVLKDGKVVHERPLPAAYVRTVSAWSATTALVTALDDAGARVSLVTPE